jgi:hypothetical protein
VKRSVSQIPYAPSGSNRNRRRRRRTLYQIKINHEVSEWNLMLARWLYFRHVHWGKTPLLEVGISLPDDTALFPQKEIGLCEALLCADFFISLSSSFCPRSKEVHRWYALRNIFFTNIVTSICFLLLYPFRVTYRIVNRISKGFEARNSVIWFTCLFSYNKSLPSRSWSNGYLNYLLSFQNNSNSPSIIFCILNNSSPYIYYAIFF